ncbi:MAG: hypothetical protein CMP63_02070 [Flavobacteriales bacterium]|nr:hypothetical protein [Flavobacteriales bacterium]|tara:strand:+ start:5558 stop:6250 length:693 start_codon:yes stop_codon:yes gene_type:complete
MRVEILFLILFPIFSMGQDYVVDEIFEPDDYSGGFAEVSSNNRFIYSWGLNVNNSELNLIKVSGSNYFDFRYQYNLPILKKVYFTSGIGLSWNIFNLNNDSNSFYIDSLFHQKRKLRFQNITSVIGLRFQGKKYPNESWCLEVNFSNEYLIRSNYITWGELDGMKYKNKFSKLNFVDKYQYGFEIRGGYKNISLFSRYRLSNLINRSMFDLDLPNLTFGLQLDIPASGDI